MIVRVSIRSCHWLPVLFVNNQTDKQISKHLLVFVRVFVSSVACSRLSDSGEDAKEKGTRKVGGAGKRGGKKEGRTAPSLPSCLPFYFGVCAFSIQQTRISRSLEQASAWVPQKFNSIQSTLFEQGKWLRSWFSDMPQDNSKGDILLFGEYLRS